jgi:asparagine synthetase B (glutamine-hydrolysing)
MAEKFSMNFSTPHFMLALEPGSCKDGGEANFQACSNDFQLNTGFSDVHPEPLEQQNEEAQIILVGSPIIGNSINKKEFLGNVLKAGEPDLDFIRNVNGEFLAFCYNKREQSLFIINDRFCSFPLYYFHDEASKSFLATMYFSDLWEKLKSSGKLKLNMKGFFEFLWFQRLFASETYAEGASYLPDASVLCLKGNKISIQQYWQRNYTKTHASLKENCGRMAELMRQTIKRKTSDNVRYGHFLSGGMDSRSVLAAFTERAKLPVCFTATIGENRELKRAREIALTKGSRHIALELDPEHYGKILEHSVRVIGGMYNYEHGLFYGFNDVVNRQVDVSFHGHGFDYMFQGMYIPGNDVVLGGRTLYLRKMREIPNDIVDFFINNASYRIKKADVWSFIKPEKRSQMEEFQRSQLSEILSAGRKLTELPCDLFEYLTFHHISRHYSYPNHASIATFVEQRTASFDNELFDFYLSLPPEQRFNGRIAKGCLKQLDPALAKIWSANTNLPVTASCWEQTLYQLAGFVKRRIVPKRQKPTWMERTWLDREYALKNQKILVNAVTEMCESDILGQLDFLDSPKINKALLEWLGGKEVYGVSGDLVQTLLTIGTFLKQ